MKLVLSDGAEVGITDYTSNSFLAETETFNEAANLYSAISRGSDSVSVERDGETVWTASGLTVEGIQITRMAAGYLAVVYFHGARAAAAEDEYSRVGRILMGVEE